MVWVESLAWKLLHAIGMTKRKINKVRTLKLIDISLKFLTPSFFPCFFFFFFTKPDRLSCGVSQGLSFAVLPSFFQCDLACSSVTCISNKLVARDNQIYVWLFWQNYFVGGFGNFFFGCAQGIWKFPGKRSNLCHSSDQSCCSDNTRSLTHCATGNSSFFLPFLLCFLLLLFFFFLTLLDLGCFSLHFKILFFNQLYIEIEFTYHIIHPFKNFQFSGFYYIHRVIQISPQLILENFHYPKEKPHVHQWSLPMSPSTTTPNFLTSNLRKP